MLSFFLLLLFLAATVVEGIRERSRQLRFNRPLALVVALIGVTLTTLQSVRHTPITDWHHTFAFPNVVLAYVERLPFDGGRFFAVVSMLLFFLAVMFCPSAPVVRLRMSRVYLMQGLLLALAYCDTVSAFLVISISLLTGFVLSVRYHVASVVEDERAELRSRAFTLYQMSAISALLVSLVLRLLDGMGVVHITPWLWWADLCILGLAAAIVVGHFPYHGWVLPFLSAPRSSIFLPMLCVETSLLFFFRIFAPLVVQHDFVTDALLPFPVVGLLYASLLFFSEQRLKRIPGCLYLSHVSLMALGALGLGQLGVAASMLDGINVLIAVVGLIAVCASLTSRFGIRGVWAPTGLGVMFPELAVCYLICVLSLVGFPGTLGFIEEELLLGHGIDRHKFLVSATVVALTLNGFTSFRLFARAFYGQPFYARDPATALLLRERVMMIVIIALIVVNGVAPAFLVRSLTALSS